MEIREFAMRVLLSDQLEQKLISPDENMTDLQPGPELRPIEPTRPANLQFAEPRTAPAMPKFVSFQQSERRAIAHHIMANHELQALEVMAWTLLAFPDAPAELRAGMVPIMADEQRHTRMHAERAAKLGLNFGDLPVNCYIWKKAMSFETVMQYMAGLPLVFEGANLDLSLEFAEAFEQAGDKRSAALMRVIYHDEIGHVKFGVEWLRKLKPADQSEWDAWLENLHWPLRPVKARGEVFQRQAREEAGMTDDFINKIEAYIDSKETDDRH
ncbi:MAG: ferritin-like domain-containing protein [Planctomycetaceae bacterium]|nr:ferritin-like domain-containing protein [Planctomycetaceae bacterium]